MEKRRLFPFALMMAGVALCTPAMSGEDGPPSNDCGATHGSQNINSRCRYSQNHLWTRRHAH